MKPVEFSEQEFEGFLYRQLGALDSRLWHPHEVLEQYLGFDRALFLTHGLMRRIRGRPGMLRGFAPYYFYDFWPDLSAGNVLKSRLPRFRLNCFLQAKRPDYGNRAPRVAAKLSRKRPVYRFKCDPDQQLTLERVATALTDRAVFAYAAPALHSSAQLFARGKAGEIVDHTTFPGVLDMSGHSRWYYNKAGTSGIRNPDTEPVTLSDFRRRLLGLTDSTGSERSQSDELVDLAGRIRGAISENAVASTREAYLGEEWASLDSFTREFELPRSVTSYLTVDFFCRVYSLSWFAYAESAV